MDEETRGAFARMDRYFELSQAQFQELSAQVTSLDHKVTSLDHKVTSLESQLRSFRDWTVGQFIAVRSDLSLIMRRVTASSAPLAENVHRANLRHHCRNDTSDRSVS